ncbi:MAG: hypothetical protein P8182_10300 [Deltaproteobacteria bacterium]
MSRIYPEKFIGRVKAAEPSLGHVFDTDLLDDYFKTKSGKEVRPMAEEQETFGTACAHCDPFPTSGNTELCNPSNVVTCEEESILARMRDIKEQLRPINRRLQEIQAYEGASLSGGVSSEDQAEWNELFGRLQELRNQWAEWERKLDGAIERKLIALGHRQPS